MANNDRADTTASVAAGLPNSFSGQPAKTGSAGTPGTWGPAPTGAVAPIPPANAADATAQGVVASPTTAWTTGQWVQGSIACSGGWMNWTGTAWASGKHA